MTRPVLSVADRDTINRAIQALIDGGIVVAPTETRYGLLVRADLASSVDRLFDLKGRIASNPTAIFVADRRDIDTLGWVTPAAERLMSELLPGPLTLVLEARTDWGPPRVVNGKVGIRWSSSEFIRQLVVGVGSSLTATSANISRQPERTTIEEIVADFGDAIDLYIDGGRLVGPVSTVVECVGDDLCILREGAVSSDRVNEIVMRA
jgi:L-threonylcarbamoyladenylate synthase